MKEKILLITFTLFFSCSTQRTSEKILVYRGNNFGEIPPCYLILKKSVKSYDLFYTGMNYGIIGDYNIVGDSLNLIPKYEYINTIKKINPMDSSFLSVPRCFLIKKNSLVEITNYDNYPILNSFITEKETFRLFQMKK